MILSFFFLFLVLRSPQEEKSVSSVSFLSPAGEHRTRIEDFELTKGISIESKVSFFFFFELSLSLSHR